MRAEDLFSGTGRSATHYMDVAAEVEPIDIGRFRRLGYRSAYHLPSPTGRTSGPEDSPEVRAVFDRYLARFCMVIDDDGKLLCPGCGSTLAGGGFVANMLGLTTFRWGIVHGAGFCTGNPLDEEASCGWPCVAYHTITVPGLDKPVRIDAVLPYHPREVIDRMVSE